MIGLTLWPGGHKGIHSEPDGMYFGIDPGITGYVAIIDRYGGVSFYPCPARKTGPKGRKEIDVRGMYNLVGDELSHCNFGYLEKVTSNAVKYAGAAFSFGANFWCWRMALEVTECAYGLITPQSWKKILGIPKRSEKSASLELAKELFPEANIGKNHNKADAVLMAEAARRTEGQ